MCVCLCTVSPRTLMGEMVHMYSYVCVALWIYFASYALRFWIVERARLFLLFIYSSRWPMPLLRVYLCFVDLKFCNRNESNRDVECVQVRHLFVVNVLNGFWLRNIFRCDIHIFTFASSFAEYKVNCGAAVSVCYFSWCEVFSLSCDSCCRMYTYTCTFCRAQRRKERKKNQSNEGERNIRHSKRKKRFYFSVVWTQVLDHEQTLQQSDEKQKARKKLPEES